MNSEQAVSVVIANHNMDRFIGQAIRSVLDQTVSPLEVIVVDDGSTDGSRDIINALAAADSRVVPIMQANAGQTRAKNAGVQRARGAFVGFCDADDFWLPNKLELQLRAFDRDNIAVVYTRAQWIDEALRPLSTVPTSWHSGRVLDQMFVENFVPFGTALVRRSALEACGGFDERYRMGIDWQLWLKLARQHEFRYLSDITYMYRVWSGQMSRNTADRFAAAFKIMRDFLQAFPGEVHPRAIREAYALTYANRAIWRAGAGPGIGSVLADLSRAMAAAPLYKYSWKAWFYAARAGGQRLRRTQSRA